MAILSLKRRFRLLEEQYRSLEETRTRLRAQHLERFIGSTEQLMDLEKRDLLEWDAQEKQFTVDWTTLFFDLLILAAQGDAEEVERLAKARFWFLDSMTRYQAKAEQEGPLIVHWQRCLADWLGYFLPHDMIDDSWAFDLWRGPWMERLPSGGEGANDDC